MLQTEVHDVKPIYKRILIRLLLMLLAAGLMVGVANGAVLLAGRRLIVSKYEAPRAQTAIVLGALVFPDGRVSDMVADRLETAYELYRDGKVAKILITGDHGQTDYDEVNTMRRYLERMGVPPQDLFMDHAGFDTYDSMYRARDVFQVKSAVVVTQAFHLPRALYIADRLGLGARGVAADRHIYWKAWYYDLREVAARVKAFSEVAVGRKPLYLGPVIPITGDGRATHDKAQ